MRVWVVLGFSLSACVLGRASSTTETKSTTGGAWMGTTDGGSASSATGTTGNVATSSGDTTGGTATTTTGTTGNASTGAATTGTSGATTGSPPNDTPPAGCTDLTHAPTSAFDTTPVHTYAWLDSACRPRSVKLSANANAGAATELNYKLADGTARKLTGGQNFGEVVSHLTDHNLVTGSCPDSPLGGTLVSYTTVFAGPHHAIHEFKSTYPLGGRHQGAATCYHVPVTIHWVFTTGRDAPLWSVTYDLSAASPLGAGEGIEADLRGPYGDVNFPNQGVVAGLQWGDSKRLITHETAGGWTPDSGFDWTEDNTGAPYIANYRTSPADAEMGLAGTRVYSKQPAGGYTRWQGQHEWRGTADWDADVWADTCATWDEDPGCHFPGHEWPFQSIEWCVDNAGDHCGANKLTWGSDWGSLGRESFTNGAGATVDGYPYVSYAVFITMDAHAVSPTLAQAAEAEVVEGTTFSATVGTVRTAGPGVDPVHTVTYSPAGFNHLYATWDVNADSNVAEVTFAVPSLTPNYGAPGLRHPVLVVHDYTGAAAPSVSWDGNALTAGTDYFVSLDSAHQRLWITLNHVVTGTHTIRID